MRDYEIVYIFAPSLEEAQVNEKLERFHALLGTTPGESAVTAMDHWGKRAMAYEVEGQASGYYVVAHFNTSAEKLPEFERILRLDEDLIRYLIVINEGNLVTTPVEATPARDEDSEEE